jgi:hypothetical protein
MCSSIHTRFTRFVLAGQANRNDSGLFLAHKAILRLRGLLKSCDTVEVVFSAGRCMWGLSFVLASVHKVLGLCLRCRVDVVTIAKDDALFGG